MAAREDPSVNMVGGWRGKQTVGLQLKGFLVNVFFRFLYVTFCEDFSFLCLVSTQGPFH